jgi:hypothetical protein
LNIRTRLASIGLAALMVLGVGGVASAATNPIDAIADIHAAQDSYAAGRYQTANRRAVIAIQSLRDLSRRDSIVRELREIGCYEQYQAWYEKGIAKMVALRAAAFGQGTRWLWAANPRRAKTLALAVYRRAAARYETAENALIDCVLDRIPTPPGWVFDLGF